jgi:YfiH family protein
MDPVLLADDTLPLPHGFFTRLGGVSEGPFASLNCSLSGKDDPAAVRENRARAARALGVAPAGLLGLTQVHGPAVADAREPWPEDARPEADALVTDRPGQALGIVTADCAPVSSPTAAGVIGAAHAGWRGAVGGVLEATIEAMERLGADRARIAAVVGPCIAQPSYEVGPDLRDAVLARDPADARFFAPGRREDRWQFDLPGYCVAASPPRAAAAPPRSASDTLGGGGALLQPRRPHARWRRPDRPPAFGHSPAGEIARCPTCTCSSS